MDGPVWIIADDNQPPWLLRRTQFARQRFGVRRPSGAFECPPGCEKLQRSGELQDAHALQAGWHVASGAWKARETLFLPEVDQPLVLIGATLHAKHPTTEWNDALKTNGGLFHLGGRLPLIQSLWLNESAASELGGTSLNDIAEAALRRGMRVIRHSALDVGFDPRPRLLQVITSLQRGGAERLVLDLHHELPRFGVGPHLLTLGSPTRAPFPAPADAIQLRLPPDPVIRAQEIMRVARQLGADAIHAHLVDGETLSRLDPELPLIVTFHNQRQSWPEAIERLRERHDALLIGCSEAVTREIETVFPQHVTRTIWNGIRVPDVKPGTSRQERPLTLVAIANPRPQKRLPLLIDVLAELSGAKLQIAGEPSSIHADAQAEVRLCHEKIAAHGLESSVEWLGAVEDVPGLLAQADVFVSTSAHEGLSLAQLEALAAGVPVVATDVGGAAEIAARHPGMMKLVPADAKPSQFAAAIREVAGKRGDGALAPDFTMRFMAERHAWLLHSLLCLSAKPKRGLLLVTNNFSTGGAQSSARRLLIKLCEMGETVRAAVIQEKPDDPTPGRHALLEAGIPIIALEPGEAMRALMPLLESIAHDPPEAVLFWNVIPEHKLLLADALHDTRIFDVSPGEMLFASLERYFANTRSGLPILDAAAYGRRLAGVIVKHESEVELAEKVFQRSVSLIPNGVRLRDSKPEAESAKWVIGTAARIHPHKRLEDLIAAFRLVNAKWPETRLRIAGAADAGQEDYAKSLMQSTADLPVEWCGEMNDLAAFHDSLCVFAMISEPAGCPNASLEAMASSLPVVATAVGGAIQQVDDGVTGFLPPPRDAEAMATALLRLLEDDELRSRMRVAALDRVKTFFSLDQMAERYRSVCLGC
ncbi:glycosyltransferase [Prosthecobacter sp.]|jgi:glycosyltransferase involved in cell wall biosynthesis|uniref:glycosyltransferase n=1 Tax=Prosthecobacter sp. TaxID=1965333 RepID=UPI0037850138